MLRHRYMCGAIRVHRASRMMPIVNGGRGREKQKRKEKRQSQFSIGIISLRDYRGRRQEEREALVYRFSVLFIHCIIWSVSYMGRPGARGHFFGEKFFKKKIFFFLSKIDVFHANPRRAHGQLKKKKKFICPHPTDPPGQVCRAPYLAVARFGMLSQFQIWKEDPENTPPLFFYDVRPRHIQQRAVKNAILGPFWGFLALFGGFFVLFLRLRPANVPGAVRVFEEFVSINSATKTSSKLDLWRMSSVLGL